MALWTCYTVNNCMGRGDWKANILGNLYVQTLEPFHPCNQSSFSLLQATSDAVVAAPDITEVDVNVLNF